MFNFKNTYSKLPVHFYQKINPEAHTSPKLIIFNKDLAGRLNLDHSSSTEDELANYLTGKRLSDSSTPIALGYAGHQFGNFVPQLGDGRAVLLGETKINNDLFDVQLKGSGRTRYSRGGDGRCAFGPAIREYLVSLYMKSLDIPTTETLAVCLSGETVQREELLPGAVLARVAKGHIRIGTFESEKVFSSIDIYKRYSYSNQPHIVMWNLSSLANCLAALLPEQDKAIESFEHELSELPQSFDNLWLNQMSKKFGIFEPNDSDKEIIYGFLNHLEENKLDFTQSFRELPTKLDSKIEIYTMIRQRLKKQNKEIQIAVDLMNASNPEIIARNHHIEEAILKSYQGDYSLVHKLAKAYASPFTALEDKDLIKAPTSQQEVKRTFCGT